MSAKMSAESLNVSSTYYKPLVSINKFEGASVNKNK